MTQHLHNSDWYNFHCKSTAIVLTIFLKKYRPLEGSCFLVCIVGGGAVASWLVRSTLERVLRVQALAGDIVFLGKTLHSHSASLHPGVQMGTGKFDAGGNPVMD